MRSLKLNLGKMLQTACASQNAHRWPALFERLFQGIGPVKGTYQPRIVFVHQLAKAGIRGIDRHIMYKPYTHTSTEISTSKHRHG